MNVADARNVLRNGSDQRFGPPLREEQAEQPTEPREQEALGQQLANDPRATRAHGRTHRHLFPAHGSAREEEICDVRIGDQQNAEHRAKQNIERGAHIADQLFAEAV